MWLAFMRNSCLMNSFEVVRLTLVRDTGLMRGKMYGNSVVLYNIVVARDNLVYNNSFMVMLS